MANGTGWKEEYLNEEGERDPDSSSEREEKFFDKISEQIKEVVRHFAKHTQRPMRGNHAKFLAGIAGARFRVSPDIPPDLAVGFLQPGKEYGAMVRFSNASSEHKEDDSKPDLRGVAVRVLTEQGAQDFLMTNAEKHHARDAREAMVAIMAGRKKHVADDFIPGETFIEEKLTGIVAFAHLVEHLGLKTAKRIKDTLSKQLDRVVKSLATETYWSRAPISIGKVPEDPEQSVAVKYRLLPVAQDQSGDERNLRQELSERVRRGEVRFLFQVQRYVDAEKTPIEDATVEWSLASSFATIAELIIPRDAEVGDGSVDGLVFSPWNIDLKNFRPLGSMNRSRGKVYAASASLR